MMKVLITGHKGFVGKYFMRDFIKKGYEITGVDLKDGNDCRDMFKHSNTKYDLVIHLAAIVGGRMTIENQPLAVATDLSIDSELCNWAVRTKPGRIVYFSSSAAYPVELQKTEYKLKESDINLNDVRNPDMTYGWAKLTGEYCLQFLENEGINVNVFRPFSGYGTDQDLDYPFPSFINRAKNLMDPFDIWGDGNQVRDFIHMTDIIGAVNKAIEEDIKGPVNLGLSRPTSFNELSDIVCGIAGYKPTINHKLTAPKGVDYRCCDNTKMLSFYQPKVPLEKGIEWALNGIISE